MAKSVVQVAGVTGTGSTTDITSTGIGTIDGAIIQIGYATAENTDTSGLRYSLVLYDGTGVVCLAIGADDAVSPVAARRRLCTGDVYQLSGSSSATAIGTVSKITNGLRISWSDTTNSSYRYRAWLLYGGHTLKVGTQQISSSVGGTASYTSASFAAEAGIFVSTRQGSLNSIGTNAEISLGAFTYKNGTITQRAACYINTHGVTTSEICGVVVDNRVMTGSDAFGLMEEAELTAVSGNGFTLTTRSVGGSPYVGFMLFGGGLSVSLFDANVPSSTGTVSLESPGFTPEFVMMVQTGLDAINTTYTNEHWYLTHGFADSATSEGAVSMFAQDAYASGSRCGCRTGSSILGGYLNTYTDDITGSVTAFDSLGFDVDYTTISGNAAGDVGFALALNFNPPPVSVDPMFFGAGV